MEQHPLQALINLIEFDRGLIKKEQQIEEIQKSIAIIKGDEQKLVTEHEGTAKHLHDAKKIVHENELRMKELDATEKKKKKQLEETDSQKTYQALKKEINFLKKSQYDHEKHLVQYWKELEAAQKTFDQDATSYKNKQAKLKEKLSTDTANIEQLKDELKQLYKERSKKEKIVPEEWIAKYNLMRTQTDNPIVPVEYDSCSGCFAQLQPQMLLDLKRKKLLQCNSCYRFIYLPNEIEKETITKQEKGSE